jgi:hypothetical protein
MWLLGEQAIQGRMKNEQQAAPEVQISEAEMAKADHHEQHPSESGITDPGPLSKVKKKPEPELEV